MTWSDHRLFNDSDDLMHANNAAQGILDEFRSTRIDGTQPQVHGQFRAVPGLARRVHARRNLAELGDRLDQTGQEPGIGRADHEIPGIYELCVMFDSRA
jgi:hypothetical protein